MKLEDLKAQGEAPAWLENTGFKTLLGGYLLPNETPRGMWRRISDDAASALNRPELADIFFNLFWSSVFCASTPIAVNLGTDRGLPISCFGSNIADQTSEILRKASEAGMLSKYGGGTAGYFGNIRPSGSVISKGGTTDGPVAFMKIFDSVISTISQGSTRRGSFAAYLPIDHPDVAAFLRMRRPEGDPNRQCLNLHHAVCISDEFMQKALSGDEKSQELLTEVYRARLETGEPYLFFSDNVNNHRPQVYADKGLEIQHSQLCNEIYLNTDSTHTFVCCLMSLNLATYHSWKDSDAIYYAIWFLDAVMTRFLEKAKGLNGLEDAIRFAERERALGLGVLGWHTLLQTEGVSMDSLRAKILNKAIFKKIKEESVRASKDLAVAYGEPSLLKGYGLRNSALNCVAPTASNSLISGNVSAGIEPISSNCYEKATAKGSFVEFNPTLKLLLAQKGKDIPEIWNQILKDEGSVRSLDCLSAEEKNVFKTAFEIDQRVLVNLAADRQPFIDQGQSLNLFFPSNTDPLYFHEVHVSAWKQKLKGLYYVRSSSVLKADLSARGSVECTVACEG